MTARRKTALVHDWLTGMRGGEKVLEAIAGLFPESPIHTLFHFPGSVSDQLESHPIRTSLLQYAPGIRRHYRNYLPFFPTAIEELDFGDSELVISSSHCVAKGVLPPRGAYHVCYCHTPMRYAWDQEHAYFPKRTGPVARLRAGVLAELRRWDVRTASRVDRFIANSSFVAERIRRYYGREADVLHPPVDTDYFTPGDDRAGDYCLMVSALAPYKRVDLAMAACERLGVELRIVGSGPQRQELEARAGSGVRFMGSVDVAELRELYRGAGCFVQPGVEDFGIAAVEALACGCPVVALGRGGIVDIVVDGEHGVLYHEGDDEGPLVEAIDKSSILSFNELNLRERAVTFSSARFVDVLRSLLET